MKLSIKSLLDSIRKHPTAVIYPLYVKLTNGDYQAAALAQIIYWNDKMGREIYKTDEEFARELHINVSSFRRTKKRLRAIDCLHVTVKGSHAKTFYRIDYEILKSNLEISADQCVQTELSASNASQVASVQTLTKDTSSVTSNSLSSDEKENEEMKKAKAWADKEPFWSDKVTSIKKFIYFYRYGDLKNQFLARSSKKTQKVYNKKTKSKDIRPWEKKIATPKKFSNLEHFKGLYEKYGESVKNSIPEQYWGDIGILV